MKLILVGYPKEELRSTLELILKNWGYRVMAAASIEHLRAFLRETQPDLLILDATTLSELDAEAREVIETRRAENQCGLFILHEKDAEMEDVSADRLISVPLDIFALFEVVQERLEEHPRKNLRMDVKLPGMFSPEGKNSFMGEILSLSPRGLFIKVGCKLQAKQKLQIVIPLIGIQKELEIEGEVLYQVLPGPENNYMQGAGIAFTNLSSTNLELLEGYLEGRLLNDIENNESGLDSRQIRLRDKEITIRPLRKER